jgi:hypothetical protein
VNRRIAFKLLIVMFFLLVPMGHGDSEARPQRECCEGDSWLSWSQDHREAYVRGYTEGYYTGYNHGCQEGTKYASKSITPGLENFPINKCLDQELDLTRGTDLSKEITTFYQQYPENRVVLIKEVLQELGKGRSIQEIHNHLPFPSASRQP